MESGSGKLAKMTAGQFYLDCMANNGHLPAGIEQDARRRPDAQKVLNAYNSMASMEEKRVLKDPNHDTLHAVGT
eukprot:6367824-Prymnesium_polylepis.1